LRDVVDAGVAEQSDDVEAQGGELPFLKRVVPGPRWHDDEQIGQGGMGERNAGVGYGTIGQAFPGVVTTNTTSQATYATAASVLRE
jgi:hypothetical protein